jgi:hypothetical protein
MVVMQFGEHEVGLNAAVAPLGSPEVTLNSALPLPVAVIVLVAENPLPTLTAVPERENAGLDVHAPDTQAPPLHDMLHPPQLFASVCIFTHVFEHSVRLPEHTQEAPVAVYVE